MTIGSQIAGFAAAVDPAIRPHISNAFLLAQLAANKRVADQGGDSRAWYDHYIAVLQGIGWTLEGDSSSTRVVSGTSIHVHEAILPVIEALLGPAVAASSTIMTVLKGLSNMQQDAPWITLFSRESQRASANQFQISYTSEEGGKPIIVLAGFELEASGSVTQILFFKLGSSAAKLKHFDIKLSVDPLIFGAVKDAIHGRVVTRVQDFIADIEI